MNLPNKCPKLASRELLFEVFKSLVPTISQLRNYYLLKSLSGRFNLNEIGISRAEMSIFKNYGVLSKNVMARLYTYYWIDVFGFNVDIFDFKMTSELPWIQRRNEKIKDDFKSI